jgi:chemotaxis protein methyltransferase CheR
MNDRHFRELLTFLGMSWEGYRRVRKGVKKRIVRHMQKLNCRDMAAYLKALSGDASARQTCGFLMTVSISRFLRDYPLWRILEHEILPSFSLKSEINIWSAGCACGEEVYSISIIGNRYKDKISSPPNIHITASDINPEYIEKARVGQYPRSSLREVPPGWHEQYFDNVKGKKWFKVKEYLKKGIDWDVRPFDRTVFRTDFDIIFLRNSLLTYYMSSPEKDMVFHSILNHLAPSGRLIIGAREKLSDHSPFLKKWASFPGIFLKNSKDYPPNPHPKKT